MVGKLAVSFCERKDNEACLCIDLWAYPDGTCNLVVSAVIGAVDYELSFPCAPHQLEAVVDGRTLYTENDQGSILVEKCGEQVCAQYESSMSGRKLRQCVALVEFSQAVDSLVAGSVGYLA